MPDIRRAEADLDELDCEEILIDEPEAEVERPSPVRKAGFMTESAVEEVKALSWDEIRESR